MPTQLLGGVNFFGIPTDEFLMIKADQDEGTVIPKPTKIYPLWGLTLWMTSDLLLRINVADDPIADKGAPRYTAWDMELLMKFFHGPKAKKLETFLLRSYLPIGLRTNAATRSIAAFAILLRIGLAYGIFFY